MTGSLFAALPISSPSPVRPVAPNCAVDSFSEFSPRTVNCASYSPTSAASGPRSARPKEEDEELFRDLFAGENGAAAGEEPSTKGKPAWSAAPTFIPQKPVMQRAPSSTGNPIPRQHLAPMKPAPPQPVLSAPFIPRLKLEELVNARPDDNDDDDDNNDSMRTSRRSSELEQVMEEDESYFDDGPSEGGDGKAAPRKAQALTRHRGFNSSLGFGNNNNQRPSNNDSLEQETLRFLERLDLKALLHTPRPDLLSFYPSMAPTPTPRSMMTSPHSKVLGVPAKPAEHFPVEKPENDRIGMPTEQSDRLHEEPLKVPRVDDVASRLAYMESTYGTAPIVRKTRRETIDRLANPISGHSSTLQALSPKQREKREAACTSRVPFSPISAAIAVSCSRYITTKKAKTPVTLLGGISKRIGDRDTPAVAKRKVTKRQDTLVHKRRSNGSTIPHVGGQGPTVNGLTKRKSKTTLGSRSLVTRKEALKKKLHSRSGSTKLGGGRQIGGSTFLTQRDDEDGVELIEDFIARNRGATQATLTFRSGTKAPSHHIIPALPTRNPSTARSRPRPPQMQTGASFARISGNSKNTHRGRGARTSRELESLGNLTDRKTARPRAPMISAHSGSDHEPVKLLFQQPVRPQARQTASTTGHSAASARSLTGRPTTPCGLSNPLRRLKVHPAMPTFLPRAPKTPPSASATLLMGLTPLRSLSGATASDLKSARLGTDKILPRKSTGSSSRGTTETSFEAPTKLSEHRKRTSTSARLNGGEKAPVPRQTFAVRRSTSRV